MRAGAHARDASTGRIPIRGSIVALPTPYVDGGLDLPGIDRLVQFQARNGTSAVMVGGATGEGWSLSIDELSQLVARAAEAAAHHSHFRMHVFAGIAEIDSRRARDMARAAVGAGADALLVSSPAFVRPTDLGLVRHFVTVADGLPSTTPIVVVNEPQRTGADLHVALVAEIAEELPHVAAHCEGLGKPARARRLADELSLPLLAGDDRMIGPYMRSGAVGAVTTVGNLVPGEVAGLMEALARRDHRADAMERHLSPLIDALRIAANPVPLKAALGAMEAISSEVRPPLAPLDGASRLALEQALSTARLLVPTV